MKNTKLHNIIIFDPNNLIESKANQLSSNYTSFVCSQESQLNLLLQKHNRSIRTLIYCTKFSMHDYEKIKAIKSVFFHLEFILLTHHHDIQIFTEIAKLGIYSIHHTSIHPAIIMLDLDEIYSKPQHSDQEILQKNMTFVLDHDLYNTYNYLLKNSKPSISSQPNLNSPRLLIVEDNKVLNSKLCHWFKTKNMIPTACFSASEALYTCKKNKYDLILLDLGLPDNHCYKLVKKLRLLSDNTPVILLTAYKDYETLLGCMKEGAFEYITKPFNPNHIINKIHQTLTYALLRSESAPST